MIDKTKLGSLDELAQTAYADQLRILNASRLPLDDQRSLFGAVRNVQLTAKAMKEKLATADERHENPSTTDEALEVCQSLSNLAPYVDEYVTKGQVPQRRKIDGMSRVLYKRAKRSGFSEGASTQFKALNIGSEDLKNFTKKLEENIHAETDADDEDIGSDE